MFPYFFYWLVKTSLHFSIKSFLVVLLVSAPFAQRTGPQSADCRRCYFVCVETLHLLLPFTFISCSSVLSSLPLNLQGEVKSEEGPEWNILRDDFMMGASMKDWDKESDGEGNSGEGGALKQEDDSD